MGIILLMFLGIRKRAYASNLGTLKGWVSAHIWIGLFLVLIVPLHSGFQFGTNVHSLAYGLMLATILSGIWGTYYYLQYPSEILSNRGGDSAKDLLKNIEYWKKAPVWTPKKISSATKIWFQLLKK